MGLLDGFPYCRTGEFIRFSICSTRARTLLSKTPQLSYFSIFVAFFNKMGPIGRAKNMFGGFSSGIHHNIQKTRKLVNVRVCQEIIVFMN